MSFIYFAQPRSGGNIKIGYSTDPITRIRQLNTGAPQPLRLIAMFPGTLTDEEILHKDLAEHRLNGEWFEDCEDVRAALTLDAYIWRALNDEIERIAREEVA